MATRKKTAAIDFAKLSNDELIGVIVGARREAQARGIALEAEGWAGALVDGERERIAQAAAAEAARFLARQEAEAAAAALVEKARREKAEAAAKARAEAEKAERERVAAAWARKKAASDRLRAILGDKVVVDRSTELKELAKVRDQLAALEASRGKWRVRLIRGFTWLLTAPGEFNSMFSHGAHWLGSEAEARAEADRLNGLAGEDLKKFEGLYRYAPDAAAEPAFDEDAIRACSERAAGLERAAAATLTSQTYRLEVWSKGADKRVYIARTGARFGDSLYDYFHTGTHKQPPGSAQCLNDQVAAAAKARGVEVGTVLAELKAFASDLCGEWESMKIEECNL